MSEDLKTIKKIIERITTKEQERQIKDAEEEIQKIQNGEKVDGRIYITEEDKKEAIKRCERWIESREEYIERIEQNKSIMMDAIEETISSKEKEDLIHKFKFYLDHASSVKRRENKFYNSHNIITLKSNIKVRHATKKINTKFYSALKKTFGADVKIYKQSTYGDSGYWTTQSLGQVLRDKDKKVDKDFPLSSVIDRELGNYFRPIRGVDEKRLVQASEKLEGEPTIYCLTYDGKDCYKKLQQIIRFKKEWYNVNQSNNIVILEEKYKELIDYSREIWYKTEVLESFKDTVIANKKFYESIEKEVSEQETKLWKLCVETDKLYEKCGLQQLVDLREKLANLNHQINELTEEIKELEKQGKYDDMKELMDKRSKLRYEMIKILKDNPDLNKTEYDIDIDYILKRERELFEPEIEKPNKKQQIIPKETVEIPKENKPADIKTTIVEELLVEKNDTISKEIIEPTTSSTGQNEKQTDKYELKSLASTYRTRYIQERINGTKLGEMDFSKYLDVIAPDQKELIDYIRKMESYTRNIYAEYLKELIYRRENGYSSISFREFARINYNIQDYYDLEIPVEIEKELKGGNVL